MGTLASLNVVLTATTLGFTKGLAAAEGDLQHFVHKAEGLLNMFGPMLNPDSILHHSLDAVKEHEAAIAKLEGILHATGGAAGMTSQEMQELAEHLQDTTKYSQTATIGAEAMLASFGKIKGDVFERAVKDVQDLSSALGKDLDSSARLVGRALQDPEAGLKRLNKAGVTFTAGQKDLIKHFEEMGEIGKAQGVILDALEGKFGGLSEAMANTTEGKLAQFQNALHHVYVEIGENLRPIVAYLTDAVKDATKWVGAHENALMAVARAALFSVAAIEGVRLAIKALAAAERIAATTAAFLKALSGPEGWVELAIGVTAATLAISVMDSALDKVGGTMHDLAERRKKLLEGHPGKPPIPDDNRVNFLKALEHDQNRLAGMASKMWSDNETPAFQYWRVLNQINVAYSAGLINLSTYRAALARAWDDYDRLGKKVREFQEDLEKQIATMGMHANMAKLWELRREGFKGAASIQTEALAREVEAAEKLHKAWEDITSLTDQANELAMGKNNFALQQLADMGASQAWLDYAKFLQQVIELYEKIANFHMPDAPSPVVRRFTNQTPGGREAFTNMQKAFEPLTKEQREHNRILTEIEHLLEQPTYVQFKF